MTPPARPARRSGQTPLRRSLPPAHWVERLTDALVWGVFLTLLALMILAVVADLTAAP